MGPRGSRLQYAAGRIDERLRRWREEEDLGREVSAEDEGRNELAHRPQDKELQEERSDTNKNLEETKEEGVLEECTLQCKEETHHLRLDELLQGSEGSVKDAEFNALSLGCLFNVEFVKGNVA